jgi:hypothetical protein
MIFRSRDASPVMNTSNSLRSASVALNRFQNDGKGEALRPALPGCDLVGYLSLGIFIPENFAKRGHEALLGSFGRGVTLAVMEIPRRIYQQLAEVRQIVSVFVVGPDFLTAFLARVDAAHPVTTALSPDAEVHLTPVVLKRFPRPAKEPSRPK